MTAARVREIRAALGLSWGELARAMGRTDDRALRRWGAGRQPIPARDAAWLEACAAAGRVVARETGLAT